MMNLVVRPAILAVHIHAHARRQQRVIQRRIKRLLASQAIGMELNTPKLFSPQPLRPRTHRIEIEPRHLRIHIRDRASSLTGESATFTTSGCVEDAKSKTATSPRPSIALRILGRVARRLEA